MTDVVKLHVLTWLLIWLLIGPLQTQVLQSVPSAHHVDGTFVHTCLLLYTVRPGTITLAAKPGKSSKDPPTH
eukprot:scaffold17425_cov38-Prasinocladus_malaysianus.AAC.1